jgi:hypothetical protein
MSRINSRTAIILSVVGVVAVLLLGWYVLIAPQRSQGAKLDTQISAADAQLAESQALLKSSVQSQSRAEYNAAVRALPDNIQMSQIIRQVSAAVGASRIELDSMTPAPPAATVGAETVPISLNLKGRYFALQKFLKLLRQSADIQNGKISSKGRLYSVDSIQYTGGSGTGGVISAAVLLNAFVYGGAPPATAAPSSTATTTTAAGATP